MPKLSNSASPPTTMPWAAFSSSNSNFCDLDYALKVFVLLPQPNTFIYNIMLRDYLQAQLYRNCIFLYAHMLENSVAPNNYSFTPVIRACSTDATVEGGKICLKRFFASLSSFLTFLIFNFSYLTYELF